jgi:hypothetical protein
MLADILPAEDTRVGSAIQRSLHARIRPSFNRVRGEYKKRNSKMVFCESEKVQASMQLAWTRFSK